MASDIIIDQPDQLIDQMGLFRRAAVALGRLGFQATCYFRPAIRQRLLKKRADGRACVRAIMLGNDRVDRLRQRAAVDDGPLTVEFVA